MKNNKKGFTLAELLIVVAIIAVLVAIAIPVFTSQLEKAREATDAANLRAAYAEIMAEAVTKDTDVTYTKTVKQTQTKTGWDNPIPFPENFEVGAPYGVTTKNCSFTYNKGTGKVTATLG